MPALAATARMVARSYPSSGEAAARRRRRILDGTEDGYEAARRPVAAGVLTMTDRMSAPRPCAAPPRVWSATPR
jgi:hypothetical protein